MYFRQNKLIDCEFFSSCVETAFKADTVIAYLNEIPRNSYLIVEGTVKAYVLDGQGAERTVAFLGDGDIVSSAFILGISSANMFYYSSVSDLKTKKFSIKGLRETLKVDQKLAYAMLRQYSRGYVSSLVRIEALIQSKANEKLLKLFKHPMMQFGSEKSDGWVTIQLRLTQSDIADMIGLTRVTVTNELAKLKKKNVIKNNGFTYEIDAQALPKLTREDFWNHLH